MHTNQTQISMPGPEIAQRFAILTQGLSSADYAITMAAGRSAARHELLSQALFFWVQP